MNAIKRYLLVFLVAVCAMLPVAFGGCSSSSQYVQGSFDCQVENYYTFASVSGSFKIDVPAKGVYNVFYDVVYVMSDGTKTTKSNDTYITATSRGEQTITVRSSLSFDENVKVTRVNLSNIDIREKYEDGEKPEFAYAIGFGAVSGAVLISAVVLFILDKKGILNKRK